MPSLVKLSRLLSQKKAYRGLNSSPSSPFRTHSSPIFRTVAEVPQKTTLERLPSQNSNTHSINCDGNTSLSSLSPQKSLCPIPPHHPLSLHPPLSLYPPLHLLSKPPFGSRNSSKNSHPILWKRQDSHFGTESSRTPIENLSFHTIKCELLENESIGLVTLSRPKVLNAISNQTTEEILKALQVFDNNSKVGCMIVTGEGKAFAAGADITEMKDFNFTSAQKKKLLAGWDAILDIKKPIIAAVNGFALGGGCELAMMCDVILVGEKAIFGQPEIKLGVIPGMGGTQRLTRLVGKSRAMEMILTGENFMDAREAVARGLASRVVEGDNEKLLVEAIEVGKKISKLSKPVLIMAKEAVNSAYELGLSEGIKKERNLFYSCFGLEDQTEGMGAFVEKRKPTFQDK